MIGPLVEEHASPGSHHKRMPVAFSGLFLSLFFSPPQNNVCCFPLRFRPGGVDLGFLVVFVDVIGPRLSLAYLHSINVEKTKSSLCLSRERCLEYRARVLENVVFVRACHFVGRLFALYGRYFQAHSRKTAKERAFCKV